MAELDLQVGANLDDVYERESTGVVADDAVFLILMSHTDVGNRYWGALRWVSGSLPVQGDTITVAYAELYVYQVTTDDVNGNWHFEKTASPVQFTTTDYDITGRTRTTASASWIADALGTGWKGSAISLVTPLQEVIDSCSPTALVLIFRPNQDMTKILYVRSHNYNSSLAAKLHIEWTPSATPPRHGFVNFQVPGIV